MKEEIEKKGAVVVETGEELPSNICDKNYQSKNILSYSEKSYLVL